MRLDRNEQPWRGFDRRNPESQGIWCHERIDMESTYVFKNDRPPPLYEVLILKKSKDERGFVFPHGVRRQKGLQYFKFNTETEKVEMSDKE